MKRLGRDHTHLKLLLKVVIFKVFVPWTSTMATPWELFRNAESHDETTYYVQHANFEKYLKINFELQQQKEMQNLSPHPRPAQSETLGS
jgi:hypothetical protein